MDRRGALVTQVLTNIERCNFSLLSCTNVDDIYRLLRLLKRNKRIQSRSLEDLALVLIRTQKGRFFSMNGTTIMCHNKDLLRFFLKNMTDLTVIRKFVHYIAAECVDTLEFLRIHTDCEGPAHDKNVNVVRRVASMLADAWPVSYEKEHRLKEMLEQSLVPTLNIVIEDLTYDDFAKVLGDFNTDDAKNDETEDA